MVFARRDFTKLPEGRRQEATEAQVPGLQTLKSKAEETQELES